MPETLLCPHCNSTANLLFSTTDINRRLSSERFDYYCCTTCKLIFLHPVPGNLGDYYPNNYYAIPDSLAALRERAAPQQYKIHRIQQYVSKGRLLEIGSAFGLFASLAKDSGFEVDAIEMDERCCQFLRDVVGIKAVQHNNPAEALKNLGQYDVIALYQVIEHLPNPWETLNVIAEHLAPGGIIVIAAPNPDSLQFKIFGSRWTHVDAPRHLQLIPLSLLSQDMLKCKLNLVFKTTSDPDSLGWNSFGWCWSLANLTTQPVLKKILYTLGRVINKLMQPFERKDMQGSTYTLVFQRPKTQNTEGNS